VDMFRSLMHISKNAKNFLITAQKHHLKKNLFPLPRTEDKNIDF